MGCYPLGKMVSKAFHKCSGKERRSSSRVVKLSPPPSYHYSRSRTVVKSVNFSDETPIVIIPPDPNPAVTLPKPHPVLETPTHHPISSSSTATSFSPETVAELRESARVRFEEPNRVRFAATGSEPHAARSPPKSPVQLEPTPVQRGPPHCYVMSPLPRWEERPRRREYFSGEYYYYPTPIREGIYNIAADPNHLTTIFSEENPNACSIV